MGRTTIIYLRLIYRSGKFYTTIGKGYLKVAFIRKRGQCYYLVHNMRKRGRVCQIYLARLGRRPRINENVIQGVASKHPFVRVDWEALKEKASRQLVQPFENNSQFLRELVAHIQELNLDIAGLHLPVLRMTMDRELVRQLISELKLLRAILDVKLGTKGRALLSSASDIRNASSERRR